MAVKQILLNLLSNFERSKIPINIPIIIGALYSPSCHTIMNQIIPDYYKLI